MIELRGITRKYDNLEVLKGIDLTVERGEIISIVGPSGAGKTTLLQIMGSLDRPGSGSVLYDRTDIFSLRPDKLAAWRNSSVGFVFQFHQLLPEFTMIENVALPALIGGKSRNVAFRRALDIIRYLGLEDRAGHKPSQLSGGERQRAAVARALVNKPMVVLADEPSGSLDSQNRDQLHSLFFELRRDFNQTFVIVTHDESLASRADRTIVMRDGLITDIITRNTTSI